jgi:hypothetical protein
MILKHAWTPVVVVLLGLSLAPACLPAETDPVGSSGLTQLSDTPQWQSPNHKYRRGAWGDYDADGDLDLALNRGPQHDPWLEVWSGTGSSLTGPVWSAAGAEQGQGVAWADWDLDGDLDLAVAVAGPSTVLASVCVYQNDGGALSLAWDSDDASYPSMTVTIDEAWSVSWGDWDQDGYPDLAAGVNGGLVMYLNTGGDLEFGFSDYLVSRPYEIAWGDWDGDSDPDLVLANYSWTAPNRSVQLLENDAGVLVDQGLHTQSDSQRDVALGDWDGDGDLDLASAGDELSLWRNVGTWTPVEEWSIQLNAWSVDLADWDGDGDLDLGVGLWEDDDRVYENQGGVPFVLAWTATVAQEVNQTERVRWADMDGDSDPDLLTVGNSNNLYMSERSRVYGNLGPHTSLQAIASWAPSTVTDSTALAWGDVDGDGDLDLAVGTAQYGPVRLHLNQGQALGLDSVAAWTSTETEATTSLAWGDFDGDGDLDLAVGNGSFQPTRVYAGDGAGGLSLAWTSTLTNSTTAVAWADLDGDGDLELAEGNTGAADRVYDFDLAAPSVAWDSGSLAGSSQALAWGDVEGDGDQDLAVAVAGGADLLYLNEAGTLEAIASWDSDEVDASTSLAWADHDGDGNLDLAVGCDGQADRLHLNVAGVLSETATWVSQEIASSTALAWGDPDNDGDLDLAVATVGAADRVHYRTVDGLETEASWLSDEVEDSLDVAWADADLDGDADLAFAITAGADRLHDNLLVGASLLPNNPTRPRLDGVSNALGESLALVGAGLGQLPLVGDPITVHFTLFDAEDDVAPRVRLEYSRLGGGQWLEGPSVTQLAASANGTAHSIDWSLGDSGFAGADGVALRLVVVAQSPTRVAFPIQRAEVSATSPPLRLYKCFPTDGDGDGWDCALDCDDVDAGAYPGAPETVDDGVDQDCDGCDTITCYEDLDGDSFHANVWAAELPCACDAFQSVTPGDCDDQNSTVSPAAYDVPDDALDQDCSGAPATTCYLDADDDGFGTSDTVIADGDCTTVPGASDSTDDCDDADPAAYPGAVEFCDAVDSDCDGSLVDEFDDTDGDADPDCVDVDDDGDGDADLTDCAPLDALVFSGAPESCDGVDSDCDGSLVDGFDDTDGDGEPDCVDVDDDGDGDPDVTDCAPLDASMHAAAVEACDAVDSDCDGSLVDGFDDTDGDGDPDCTDPDDDGDGDADATDCAPLDALVFSGASESCDAVDSDCDGSLVDEFDDTDGDGEPDCVDEDDDGDGDPDATDCEPLNDQIHADAEEDCEDGIDSDCDGSQVDEFPDFDGDAIPDCLDTDADGDGHTSTTDCDALDPDTYPGAQELCDGRDNDCDGGLPADEQDVDQDGSMPCAGDCDDGDAEVGPGQQEACNGLDDDCDGAAAPGETDGDGDGYLACAECDDAAEGVHPGADEACDGLDTDCDGVVPTDEGDQDGDGWTGCGGDCDDGSGEVNPDIDEALHCGDAVDNDCDGAEEEGLEDPDCLAGCGCSATLRTQPAGGAAVALLLIPGLVARRRRR